MMSATPTYMIARGDGRIKSITFFTSMVDFEDPGDGGLPGIEDAPGSYVLVKTSG